jgi:hypothetical protein
MFRGTLAVPRPTSEAIANTTSPLISGSGLMLVLQLAAARVNINRITA